MRKASYAESIPKRRLGRTNLRVSSIGFGTAELGFVYGIGPRDMPSEEEAIRILHEAVESGITFFDTAHFYGFAQERMGKSGITRMPDVVVATKCAQFLERGENPPRNELEKRIRGEVETNLRNLNLETLTLLQLHGGTREQIERGDMIEILGKIKEEGKAQFVGISTRGEEAPIAAINSRFFDVIHVPYSILDQRIGKAVLFEANKNDIGVIVRSVLLKGALTPAVIHLPDELRKLKENSARASKIANKLGISLPELAIRFTLSSKYIDVALVGTNRYDHLQNAVDAARKGPLSPDAISELKKLAIDEVSNVDPAHWPPCSVSDSKEGEKLLPHFHKGTR